MSLLPLEASTNRISLLTPLSWNDKFLHLIVFAVLYFGGLQAYSGQAFRLFWGLLAFGAGIEIVQAYTPWRQAEIADLVADIAGLILGLTIHKIILQKRST